MSHGCLLLYASPNGDRWSLCRGAAPGDVFVQHEPNGPSGGATTRIAIGLFLREGADGPEHQALLTLIGLLVAVPDLVAASSVQPEPGAAAAEPSLGAERGGLNPSSS